MEKEKLVINKDNYKGYAELYAFKRQGIYCEDYTIWNNYIKKLLIFFGIAVAVLMITLPLNKLALLPEIIKYIEILLLWIGVSGFTVDYIIKLNNYKKKKINQIKEEYPYVDTKIDILELEKSLEEARIITYEHRDSYTIEIMDVKGYENYIKCEEIKENYLEETKYKGYQINPMITDKELPKPKIKKLVR